MDFISSFNLCQIPSSKSQTMRALLFAAMGTGKSTIYDPLISNDTKQLSSILKQLGVSIRSFATHLEVDGCGGRFLPISDPIDVGNSGIIFRFLPPLLALTPHSYILTGDHSIQTNREIDPLLTALTSLGAKAEKLTKHNAPIRIQGPITPKDLTLDSLDSQPISALALALSFMKGESKIQLLSTSELPWIHMTIDWLKKFNSSISLEDLTISLPDPPLKYSGFTYHVPTDISSALFFVALGLLGKTPTLISPFVYDPMQGDFEALQILQSMGAKLGLQEEITAYPSALSGIECDLDRCIDALPMLACIATQASTPSRFTNLLSARHKECDRISCVALELKKMGAKIEEGLDSLTIYPSALHSTTIDSHNDHRIAMAFSILASALNLPIQVEKTACVNKTFPMFFEQLHRFNRSVVFEQ